MPTTLGLGAEVREIQARVEDALHKNGNMTISDLAWLILALTKLDCRIADVLDKLCAGKPVPRWQITLVDEATKWGARAFIALVLYWVVLAIKGGWTP